MSSVPPVSELNASTSIQAASPSPFKSKRVLACIRCQKRKIRCDRKFPCVHCKTADTQCVPATVTPRGWRRRRFPERELLERLRTYEDLLRQNNIKFEPLHKNPDGERESPSTQGGDDSENEQVGVDWSSPAATIKSESVYEARDYWRALNSRGQQDADDESDSSLDQLHQLLVKKSWMQLFGDNDHLLFGSPNPNIDLYTLHPDPAQIFRLWQIYLENINPLLKVSHCTSLQARIVEAAGNVKTINPVLEALMFSIYCISIQSLASNDCVAIFGSSKEDLLTGFQFGCQQALQKCGFLRSSDRECLTALYLYLVSVRPTIVPQSLSAMLGVAIRIAQRMGIHNFGGRSYSSIAAISEMSGHKSATLAPNWDCNIPLNVNDSDFRPEMQAPPQAQAKSTDALFAVVRSEVAEFIRHTHFYLDFTNPALKPILKTAQHDPGSEVAELAALEKRIEDKYLKFCDKQNPLHFMTIWWTRAYFAKCHLMEYHARNSSASINQPEKERDEAISYAIRMLECDTMFNSSPLTKGFLWHVHLHFPFPAYLQIVQDLKRRPSSDLSELAWEAMSNNFETLVEFLHGDKQRPFFEGFAKLILQAWEVREASLSKTGDPATLPRVVSSIRYRLAQITQSSPPDFQSSNDIMGPINHGFPLSMPMGSDNGGPLYNIGAQPELGGMNLSFDQNMLGNPPMDVNLSHLDWAMMDWRFGSVYPVV